MAIVYEEGSCLSSTYYCDTDTTTGLLDITTIIDLTTAESDSCYSAAEENNCGPGKSICNFFDCNDSELGLDANQSIPCNPQLTLDGYLSNDSYIGNDTCDYYGIIENTLYNFTSCPEFGYDEGDCDVIDCRGIYFSDDLCATTIEYEPIIDTLINLLPDSAVIQTSTLITKIEGCINGTYKDFTTIDTKYSYNSIDSIVTIIDTTEIGSTGWMGDGECDSKGYLFDNFGLDFDCIEYDFEGGDCYVLDKVKTRQKKKIKQVDYIK